MAKGFFEGRDQGHRFSPVKTPITSVRREKLLPGSSSSVREATAFLQATFWIDT
jgi:hypothetical protein